MASPGSLTDHEAPSSIVPCEYREWVGDTITVACCGSVDIGWSAIVVVSTTAAAPGSPSSLENVMAKTPGAGSVIVAVADVMTAWRSSALVTTASV